MMKDWRKPAPLRELDMWDYMAVGFFAGVMLITILSVTIYYWILMH